MIRKDNPPWLKAGLHAMATAMAIFSAFSGTDSARAADFSQTEIQYQFGRLTNPFADTKSGTNIFTVDHISAYKWGDVYFFVDLVDDGNGDNFNRKDAYSEGYAFFSSAKLLGAKYGGIIKDVGVFASYNYAPDSGFLAYVPGVYVDWNIAGIPFLRSYVARRFDNSDFHEEDGWHADTWWTIPFELGNQRFLFTGHFEYMSQDRNDFGETHDWWLAQPQLRWDVGYAMTGRKDVFYIGTEYQGWVNKLGTEENESAFQALAVWRF